jgi:hypothetical protein
VRWNTHRRELRENDHHARFLQRTWNKYGEDAFSFSVLLLCGEQNLLLYEQLALDALEPEFNTCRVAGSTLGVPLSAAQRAALSDALRLRIAANPEAHAKLTRLANEANRVSWTDPEQREKRVAANRRGAGRLRKQITLDGVTKTRQEWAASLGIAPSTLDRRIQRWGLEKALTIRGTGKNTQEMFLLRSVMRGVRTFTYQGRELTLTALAHRLGTSRQALLWHLKRKPIEAAIAHFESKQHG